MENRSSVSLTLTVGSRGELSVRRAEIRAWVRLRADDAQSNDVMLACGEAIDNGLEHGIPPVTVHMDVAADNLLTIVVRDEGTWRISAAATPPRGLGLSTMMALMDNVTVDTTDGTAVRLSRRL